jgi:SAM-dependent methyltransferase
MEQIMRLLRLHPVARAVHHIGNDYNLSVPHNFLAAAWLGGALILGAALWLALATSPFAAIPLVVGVLLITPAMIAWFVLRNIRLRRMNIRERIASEINWRGDEMVLDVGVGSGITLFGCAKNLTTGKAIGIDIYHPHAGGGTPEIFWKNAANEGVTEQVELQQVDARDMPYEDATFDVIVSTGAFHHIGDSTSRQRAANEVIRTLKPGGKILVKDIPHALVELEHAMRAAGFHIQKEGDAFLLLIGAKIG